MSQNSSKSIISVLLFSGLPASGKSTLASALVNNIHQMIGKHAKLPNYDSVTLIDYDAIMEDELKQHKEEISGDDKIVLRNRKNDNFFSDAELQSWRKSRKIALDILIRHLSTLEERKNKGLIIMDDNFHLRSMRREIFKICQRFCSSSSRESNIIISFSIVLLDVDVAKCLERNRSRCVQRQVPDSVILKMSRTLERPHTERNSWERSSLILMDDDNEVDDTLDEIIETISNSIKNPIEPPPPVKDNSEDRAITSKNDVHNADKILRRIVGVTCRRDKRWGQNANKTRKIILDDVRVGRLCVTIDDITTESMLVERFLALMETTGLESESIEGIRADYGALSKT